MPAPIERLILVVDDDAGLREIAMLLLVDKGYGVVAAADAQEALELIDAHPAIALLFTDLQMPGLLDGYGLIAYLRADGNNLPAILTSGLGSSPKGLPPRTSFLSKPYTAAISCRTSRRLSVTDSEVQSATPASIGDVSEASAARARAKCTALS